MQIEDFKGLTHAERELTENCRNGLMTIMNRERPQKATPDNTICAGLIRALLLDTGERPPPGATTRPFAPGSMRWTCLSRWMLWGRKKHGRRSASRGWWGEVGHRLRWLVQMAGWVITAIGAAVVTGLIGRRD